MKKKSSNYSAFFNPRALFGLLLCFGGISLAFFARTSFGVASDPATEKAPVTAPAPQISIGVKPVVTGALRDMTVIQPSMAPGHDHVEPVIPPPPAEGAGLDTARQT